MLVRCSARSLISMSHSDIHCHGEGTNLEIVHQNQSKIASKNLSFANSQLGCNFFSKTFYYQCNSFQSVILSFNIHHECMHVAPMVLSHIFLYSNILPLVIPSFEVCFVCLFFFFENAV